MENHNYDQIQKIYWRNSNIDFSSIESVLSSLKQFPIQNFFIHKKNALDEINFKSLIEDHEVLQYLTNSHNIKLLWKICRIPDFEKIFNDNYIIFLKNIFLILIKNNLKIPEDWINEKVLKLENYQGDIPELSLKISQIRTWTYIANHHAWFINPYYWQEKTQIIENELSDNLHDGLTKKFIDSSSRHFIGNPLEEKVEKVEITNKNDVILDGKKYGNIRGFELFLDNKDISNSLFFISHVKKSIRNMIEEKIDNFLNAPNDSINLGDISNIKLSDTVFIYWGEEKIGKLIKGSKLYLPIAESLNSEFLSSERKLLISSKLQTWIENELQTQLNPIKNKIGDDISSQARRVIFNCFENLGTFSTDDFKDFIKKIDQQSKSSLSKLGIRIGAKFFFCPNLLKKRPIELCSLLWKVYNNPSQDNYLPLPKNGRVSFTSEIKMPDNYWQSIGYICINNFAFRVDVFEKIFFIARQKIKKGPFLESPDLMNPIGCNSNQLKDILDFCGFTSIKLNDEKRLYLIKQSKLSKDLHSKNKKNFKKRNRVTKKIKSDPNSPFAVLQKLL